MPFKLFHIESQAGQAVQMGEAQIIPFSRSIRLEFPGALGGFIWNRPSSILVKKDDGSEQVLNIPDVTRQVQIALLGFGVLGGIVLSMLMIIVNRRLNLTGTSVR